MMTTTARVVLISCVEKLGSRVIVTIVTGESWPRMCTGGPMVIEGKQSPHLLGYRDGAAVTRAVVRVESNRGIVKTAKQLDKIVEQAVKNQENRSTKR